MHLANIFVCHSFSLKGKARRDWRASLSDCCVCRHHAQDDLAKLLLRCLLQSESDKLFNERREDGFRRVIIAVVAILLGPFVCLGAQLRIVNDLAKLGVSAIMRPPLRPACHWSRRRFRPFRRDRAAFRPTGDSAGFLRPYSPPAPMPCMQPGQSSRD